MPFLLDKAIKFNFKFTLEGNIVWSFYMIRWAYSWLLARKEIGEILLILSGRKPLTLELAKLFHRELNIPAEVLLS